jgi:glycosyltransferase involved in cell wall biosynthesis
MKTLTIFTPAYNRAHTLVRTYQSLCRQTCKDFEWIITDDGSTDNTEELVKQWIEETKEFPIYYNKLPHVGIPRALNSGVAMAHTDWFMMLDSDDCILPETVEKVFRWLDEIRDDSSFIGIGYAKCFPNGEYMKKQTPLINPSIGYVDATNIERKKYRLNMDMEEVSRVDLLRQYPFRFWDSEKYAPEQLNYNEIALAGYKYRWRNDRLYICDYLPDGQTRDDRIVKNNPMGFAMMHNQNMLIADSTKDKLRAAMQMTALSLCSGNPRYLLKSNCKWATILTLPVGIALSVRRKIQFAKMDK